MTHSPAFLRALIDTLSDNIAVIDAKGELLFVNSSWRRFGDDNGQPQPAPAHPHNYLRVCDAAAATGDSHGRQAAAGLRALLSGRHGEFVLEYPCHGPGEQRWFLMSAQRLQWDGPPLFVIAHKDITRRKLAEQAAERLSLTDRVTQLANRRHFDQFLHREWRARARRHEPLGLIMLDIDHFKLFNDRYGHPAGDECLRQVADALKQFAQRPQDLSARYGGEEFALVLGDVDTQPARHIAAQILDAVHELHIPNEDSPTAPYLTVSLGVAATRPGPRQDESELLEAADAALYRAKSDGRDRIALAA